MKFEAETIKEGRDVKKKAREASVDLRGGKNDDFKEMTSIIKGVVARMIEENKDNIDKEWRSLDRYSKETGGSVPEEVAGTFAAGDSDVGVSAR